MLPDLPSCVSDQCPADGDRRFLPVYRQASTGVDPFPVQADRVPASSDNHTADGIGSRRRIVGGAAGRPAGFYNGFDHVEIILEKDLGGIYLCREGS